MRMFIYLGLLFAVFDGEWLIAWCNLCAMIFSVGYPHRNITTP